MAPMDYDPMDYDTILYDVDDPVATITLNRPQSLNGWTMRMAAEVRHAVDDLLASSGLYGAPVFPVSSLTGAGIPELAAALLSERGAKGSDPDHLFRLAIDRAFLVTGAGTVVTGTVLAGHTQLGETLAVSPLGREVRVRSLLGVGWRGDHLCHLDYGPRGGFLGLPRCPADRLDTALARFARLYADQTEAEFFRARLHVRVGQHAIGIGVDLGDDVARLDVFFDRLDQHLGRLTCSGLAYAI